MTYTNISYNQALELIGEHIRPLPTHQTVPWRQCLNTTLAKDLYSSEDIPLFDNSAVDGYAVLAEDTMNASKDHPVQLTLIEEIFAGPYSPQNEVVSGAAAKIMTGAPVPKGANAVVMIEQTQAQNQSVFVFSSVKIGQHIRKKGEELAAGSLLLDEGTFIGPVEYGWLGMQGIREVCVRPFPSIAVLTSGDELVEPEEPVQLGQVRNINTYTLCAELNRFGCQATNLGIVRDNPEQIESMLKNAIANTQFLITTGGVSAGEKDFLPGILKKLGAEIIFHKVMVKPGKPLLFAKLNNCYIFALPGNVVSSFTSLHLFVKPAIRLMAGQRKWRNQPSYVRLSRRLQKTDNRTEFVRCRIAYSPTEIPIAIPFDKQGSGMISSMLNANGFAVIPADVQIVEEFDVLEFISLKNC